MSAHIAIEELEALASGEVSGARRAVIERHLANCAMCQKEARWLEAERSLFGRRRQEAPPVEVSKLWDGVNERVEGRRRARGQTLLVGSALVAAAAITVFLLWSGGAGDPGRTAVGPTLGPQPAAAADDLAPAERPVADDVARSDQDVEPSPTADLDSARRDRPEPALEELLHELLDEPLDELLGELLDEPLDERLHELLDEQLYERLYERLEALDDDEAPAKRDTVAATTSRPVSGPVTLFASSMSGSITVRAGAGDRVLLDAGGAGRADLVFDPAHKGSIVTLDGRRNLRDASIRIEVPVGSSLSLRSVSGDLRVEGVRGDLTLKTASGDISAKGAREVDASTASGDIVLAQVAGAVRVRTASGQTEVQTTSRTGTAVEAKTASGDLVWSGTCGDGCKLAIETVSGDARLTFTPQSSFGVVFSSMSGRLRDRRGRTPGSPGSTAGAVRFSSMSGSLEIRPAGR